MNEFEKQLEQELIEQGASGEELRGLVEFKNKITKLSDMGRSDAFKRSYLQKLEERENHRQLYPQRRLFTPVFLFALLILLFITGVVSAQNSLPGQILYPVKILSEDMMKIVNPSFKDEILKRRSEEIKTLTQEKKDSVEFNKTIDRYEKDLEENKTIDTTKIEESKKNLEDARNNSEDEEKREIESVIIQTEKRISQSHEDENENRREDVKGEQTKVNSENNRDGSNDENNGENKGENKNENRKD